MGNGAVQNVNLPQIVPRLSVCMWKQSTCKRRALCVKFARNIVQPGILWTFTNIVTIATVKFRHCSYSSHEINLVHISVYVSGDVAEIESAIESLMTKDHSGFWRCCSCDYANSTKATVKAHVEAKHISSSGFQCPQCLKICPTRHAMKMHKIRNKH